MRSDIAGLLVFTVLGCVSAGTGSGKRAVPVYSTGDDVPCEYEVMQTIVAKCTVWNPSRMRTNSECAREQVLGEAGAKAGADAVILPEPESPPRLPTFVEGQPVDLRFEGEAVRYLDPTCGTKRETGR